MRANIMYVDVILYFKKECIQSDKVCIYDMTLNLYYEYIGRYNQSSDSMCLVLDDWL